MYYEVFDYYEKLFGKRIFTSKSYNECLAFFEEWLEDTDCECDLVIKDNNGKIVYSQF